MDLFIPKSMIQIDRLTELKSYFFVGTISGTIRNVGRSILEAMCGDAERWSGGGVVVALDSRTLGPFLVLLSELV